MGLTRSFLRSRLVWTVMAFLFVLALGRMALRRLARDPRFIALPNRVAVGAPRWGGDEVVAPVRDRLKALGRINLFDPDFASKVRGSLLEVPGVERVDEIRRLWPDRYSVELTLHRPAAVVAYEDREVPVTWGRVALPSGPYRRAVRGLLRIGGVEREPPGLGAPWADERLSRGLAALRQLAPYLGELNRLGIGEIDTSLSDDPLEGVVLRGRLGITIRWGRPLATVGENPVETKIGYLREAARYVEQVRGVEIDVRFDTILVWDLPEQ